MDSNGQRNYTEYIHNAIIHSFIHSLTADLCRFTGGSSCRSHHASLYLIIIRMKCRLSSGVIPPGIFTFTYDVLTFKQRRWSRAWSQAAEEDWRWLIRDDRPREQWLRPSEWVNTATHLRNTPTDSSTEGGMNTHRPNSKNTPSIKPQWI